jgi:hypothetical protein
MVYSGAQTPGEDWRSRLCRELLSAHLKNKNKAASRPSSTSKMSTLTANLAVRILCYGGGLCLALLGIGVTDEGIRSSTWHIGVFGCTLLIFSYRVVRWTLRQKR